MVSILDTTLREGEQAPNVKFTKEQKIKIAKLLDNFGVDIIEVGHPIISKYDKECVKAVASLNLKTETLAHARARKEDIDAVIDCDAFTHTADLHIKAVRKEPKSYESINPTILGRKRKYYKKNGI